MSFNEAKSMINAQEGLREITPRIAGRKSQEAETNLGISETELGYLLKHDEEAQKNKKIILELSRSLGIEEKEIKETANEGLKYSILASTKLGLIPKKGINPAEYKEELVKKITKESEREDKQAIKEMLSKENNIEAKEELGKLGEIVYEQYNETEMDTEKIIQRIIGAYFLNLRKCLKIFNQGNKELKESGQEDWIPNNLLILSIAKRAYTQDPEIYFKLLKDYQGHEDVGKAVISMAVLSHSNDPAGWIKNFYLEKLKELTEEYKDNEEVGKTVISLALLNQKDPAGWIENFYLKKLNELTEEYQDNKDVGKKVISTALLSHSNDPADWIENFYLKKLNEFTEEYQDNEDVGKTVISMAVLSHSNDPADWIENFYLEKLNELTKEYKDDKDVGKVVISRAVLGHSNDPAGWIKNFYLKNLKDLTEEYQGNEYVNKSIISTAILKQKKPKDWIEKVYLKNNKNQ